LESFFFIDLLSRPEGAKTYITLQAKRNEALRKVLSILTEYFSNQYLKMTKDIVEFMLVIKLALE